MNALTGSTLWPPPVSHSRVPPPGQQSVTLPHNNDSVVKPLMTCFLVEDSPIIRQNLIATLEEMLALKVIGSAEDEPSAKAWMRSAGQRCDLMIIDIFLKTGTGLAVVEEARRQLPKTKLVVLSNYATSDMRNRCLELGADRVFDKSSELEELLAYCEALTAQ
jgi:DNA-binding NarL/FixJ family response regulator